MHRNPWGADHLAGIPTDANPADGYITLTANQFYGYFTGGVTSNV